VDLRHDSNSLNKCPIHESVFADTYMRSNRVTAENHGQIPINISDTFADGVAALKTLKRKPLIGHFSRISKPSHDTSKGKSKYRDPL
jgi:hypothetical protein